MRLENIMHHSCEGWRGPLLLFLRNGENGPGVLRENENSLRPCTLSLATTTLNALAPLHFPPPRRCRRCLGRLRLAHHERC